MLQKLYVFFRKETVLSIAVILALLSMFWVRPDKAYFTYIDFRTLGLLFLPHTNPPFGKSSNNDNCRYVTLSPNPRITSVLSAKRLRVI